MNIKILAEDKLFSKYIRKRDKKCSRCGSLVQFNEKGDPVSHSASHYITRGNWATRMDQMNVTTLCFPCHQKWGGDDREGYKWFMKGWLGKEGFQDLLKRSNEPASKRKIRMWAKGYYKEKLSKL